MAGVLASMASVQPAVAAPGYITQVPGYFNQPWGVAWANGNLYVTSSAGSLGDFLTRVDPSGVSTIAAGGQSPSDGIGDGLPGVQAALNSPRGVIVDPSGNILIADCGNHRVRKLAPNGIITTVAGGGTPADGLGDNGPATAAVLDCPSGLALVTSGANAGTLYIADAGSNRVRKVAPNGIITTVAGT
ncbi:MAG: hypothetical protein M3010_01875, partial [Candidatus Dormibacteraeota bacterium]|nr:hypothetical protein [Candidatus Dormibacteraeota bacterium]